jgi:hypothetical protein
MEKLAYLNTSEVIEGYAESLIAKAERNDCVVRAMASSLEIPYDKAHSFVAQTFKRRPGRGVPTFPLLSWLNGNFEICGDKSSEYAKYESPCTYDSKGKRYNISVGKFAKLNSKGTYFMLVKGHAFTIKDGSVIGNQSDANKPRTIVRYAFKIK